MYDVFVQLCQKKGVTPYRVAAETGIPKSTFTEWKTGRSTPKTAKLQKIADYFQVSVDYLMTGHEPDADDDSPYYSDPEVRKIANEIYQNPDLKVLMDASKTMSKDDIIMVTKLISKIKQSQEE